MSDIVRELERVVETARDHVRALRIAGDEDVTEVQELLECLQVTEARLAGMRLELLGEAQLAGAARVVDQLRSSARTTTGQASAALRLAGELSDRFWVLAEALGEGSISVAQAEAIVTGLKRLPVSLGRHDLERCQRQLLTFCDRLGPAELRVAALRVWELLDPEAAEACEAQRLAREERRAKAGRSFRLTPDFHGSMRISGQLPTADAALLQAQLDALMPPASSYAGDDGEIPSLDARRADALLRLVGTAAASGEVPEHGGDRPHVHITLPFTMLAGGGGGAAVFGFDGETLSAGEARRMACDAGIIPVVLGTESQPLDVGREYRLVTKALRVALLQRDRGCAFPHCTARPAACEAHHIQPWWAGGETSLHNLVLLCPHHHRLVEPDPNRAPEWQWAIRLCPETGRPLFVPPRHVDPTRTPRQHRRFTLNEMTAPPPDEERLRPETEPWSAPPPPEPADDPWHPVEEWPAAAQPRAPSESQAS